MPRNFKTGFFSQSMSLYDWPDDCMIQGGGDGLVFTQKGSLEKALSDPGAALKAVIGKPDEPHYRTAFFEAFPRNPSTFIRGEGKTLHEAEESAWKQWQQVSGCTSHEFERRNYRQGQGFCKHCGLFASHAFESLDRCHICNEEAYSTDKHDRFHCKKHYRLILEEDKSEMHKMADRLRVANEVKLKIQYSKGNQWFDLEGQPHFDFATDISDAMHALPEDKVYRGVPVTTPSPCEK